MVNRCLEAYLWFFAHEQPTKCSAYLPWVEFSYNTGHHTSTGTTPFTVVYGRDPPPLDTKNDKFEQKLMNWDDMLHLLRLNHTKA